ncbi:MAG TPA: heavy metal sensor histidine kinase [Planctomycetota bacterium]|jgi:two-component system heavy metal sensor histidine kinase CusS
MSPKSPIEALAKKRRWSGLLYPQSLAGRLTAWYTCTTFILVLVVTWLLYAALVNMFDREAEDFLKDNIAKLAQTLRRSPDDLKSLRQEVEQQLPIRQYARVYVRVLGVNGELLAETPYMSNVIGPNSFGSPVALADENPCREIRAADGALFYGLYTSFYLGQGAGHRIVQIACDRSREAGVLRSYRHYVAYVLVAALLLCALVGYNIAHRGLHPVAQIAQAAALVRSTTLHERLGTDGLPRELTALADRFNEMLDRLQDSFRRLQQFSADIAHELRTPVNNLRGEVEVALGKSRTLEEYRDTLGSVLEECERLSRMVDRLLFIARMENGVSAIAIERTTLLPELAKVRDFYEAPAGEAGVTITLQGDERLQADVNVDLFHNAVGNLIANAVDHTASGGRVLVSVSAAPSAVRVTVRDNGCGIAPEHLPHVFDRFYRVDHARSKALGGMGLGLSIVRSIAQLHKGTLKITSELGKGTCVTIDFPLPAPASQPALASGNAPAKV